MEQKNITLHNTPQFYVEYMRNWIMHKRQGKPKAAEMLILEDIATLVEVGASALNSVPAEQEK